MTKCIICGKQLQRAKGSGRDKIVCDGECTRIRASQKQRENRAKRINKPGADLEWRMNVLARVEIYRVTNRHQEAQALHRIYFDTPYRESPQSTRVITGNRP